MRVRTHTDQKYRRRKTQDNIPYCYGASQNTKPRNSTLHQSGIVSQYPACPSSFWHFWRRKGAPTVHPASDWEECAWGVPKGIHIVSWVKITSVCTRQIIFFYVNKHNGKTCQFRKAVFHRPLNCHHRNLKLNSSMLNWKKTKKTQKPGKSQLEEVCKYKI